MASDHLFGQLRDRFRLAAVPRDIARLEEQLSDLLASQVTIKLGARHRGQLIIDFASLDSLDGIIARLHSNEAISL